MGDTASCAFRVPYLVPKCYPLGLVPLKGKDDHKLLVIRFRFHLLNKGWSMALFVYVFIAVGERGQGFAHAKASAVMISSHQSNVGY